MPHFVASVTQAGSSFDSVELGFGTTLLASMGPTMHHMNGLLTRRERVVPSVTW